MVDMAHRIEPEARFFYVDTGLLFPETYATRDALAERYGIEFERIAERVEAAASLDRDGCCADRKVELMRTALDEVSCWVSGIRRVDSETRADAPEVRLGRAVRALEAQPPGRLGRKAGLELHQGPPRALQPASRPGLSLDRMHALHHGRARAAAGERAGRWAGTDRTECGIHG